ncbi:hypothetical protein FHG87_008982 [Trinorchestia longiramus]|nr:hypothetical protein FHG87_008982 [Trinorchestia longiramus]
MVHFALQLQKLHVIISCSVLEEPVQPELQVETIHTEIIQPEPAAVETRTVKTTKKIIRKKKRVEVEATGVSEAEEQPEVHEVIETRITEEIPQELPQPTPVEPVITEVLEEPQPETHHTEILHIETAPVSETKVQTTTKIIKKKKQTETKVTEVPQAPIEHITTDIHEEPLLETYTTEIVQVDSAPVEAATAVVREETLVEKHSTEVVEVETEEAAAPEVITVIPETMPDEIIEPTEIAPLEPTTAVVHEEPLLETHTTEVVQVDTGN